MNIIYFILFLNGHVRLVNYDYGHFINETLGAFNGAF